MASVDIIEPYNMLLNGDMTTTLTSDWMDIRHFGNISIDCIASGSPVGTFTVNLSPNKINFGALPLNPVPVFTGSSGMVSMMLYGLAKGYLQVVYTPTSGSGLLTIIGEAKFT
jgi:hypothetical protein